MFDCSRIIGWFDMRTPAFFVRDPELIHHISNRKIEHFINHEVLVGQTDPLFGNSLPLLQGEKWREMRTTLTPAFSGSKMRHMFELVMECAEETVSHLRKRLERTDSIGYDVVELFNRSAIDAIASCMFGLKINSLEEPNNEFFKTGASIFRFDSIEFLARIAVLRLFPSLSTWLGIGLQPEKTRQFFHSLVMDNIKSREAGNISRPDMISILQKLRKGQSIDSNEGDESSAGEARIKRSWTDDELVSQSFIFFFAGFETTSTLMAFTAYELALNPKIQEKLFDEIRQMNDSLNGERASYDSVMQLKYLDQVISEGLRKWPSVVSMDRVCSKDFVYEDGQQQFVIKKDQVLAVPIYNIHRDPKYFPEPELFDPERFSDENRRKIPKGAFFPFGSGPRTCIG